MFEQDKKNVWIVGHSLRVSITMLVGRNMARDEHLLQVHLFNPPFFLVLIQGYLIYDLVVFVAIVALMDKHSCIEPHKAFLALGSWVLYLNFNTMDDICSPYVS